MSQVSLVPEALKTEWLKSGSVAIQTGWPSERVSSLAQKFGIRRLLRPGRKPLYNAEDVANLRIEDSIVGPGIGPDGLPRNQPTGTTSS